MKAILAFALCTVSCLALAAPNHSMMKPTPMPKEFDTLKTLVGTWTGTTKMNGKEMPVTVTYELVAGGTTLMEKSMAGTDHEMVTMYHRDGNTMAMTHYCPIGNQPMMMMKKATAKMMEFEMTKPMGVTSMNEPHMHAMTMTMDDANTMKQDWMMMMDGKKGETATIMLKRKM